MHGNELNNLFCSPDSSIKEAMAALNKARGQLLLVTDAGKRLQGVITDGDIRRALLNSAPLKTPVFEIMNRKPKTISPPMIKNAAQKMKEYSIKQIPVVDDDGTVVDIIIWEDLIGVQADKPRFDNPVVVMAGGKGTRLDPFTRILPKPLIPVGDKPIIEIVMDKCKNHGFNQFIISLNYKDGMIKHYFAENGNNCTINFVEEEKPLGTAGSLYLVKDFIKDAFIVTNCDVIIDVDYGNLLKFHKKNGFRITIVGVLKNFTIPYGIVNMDNGHLVNIIEKPEYDFVVNAGVYMMEPEVLSLIEANTYLDMPEFLLAAKKENYSVGVYPYSGEWVDVGQWEEYKKSLALMG